MASIGQPFLPDEGVTQIRVYHSSLFWVTVLGTVAVCAIVVAFSSDTPPPEVQAVQAAQLPEWLDNYILFWKRYGQFLADAGACLLTTLFIKKWFTIAESGVLPGALRLSSILGVLLMLLGFAFLKPTVCVFGALLLLGLLWGTVCAGHLQPRVAEAEARRRDYWVLSCAASVMGFLVIMIGHEFNCMKTGRPAPASSPIGPPIIQVGKLLAITGFLVSLWCQVKAIRLECPACTVVFVASVFSLLGALCVTVAPMVPTTSFIGPLELRAWVSIAGSKMIFFFLLINICLENGKSTVCDSETNSTDSIDITDFWLSMAGGFVMLIGLDLQYLYSIT